jgi:DNA-binding NtrC family response regulator
MQGTFTEAQCITKHDGTGLKENLSIRRKRILIVDDDVSVRFLIKDAFSICTSNCDTITARNGSEAIQMLQSDVPVDFILAGMDLPMMNGYEFLSHLKENYPDIPVLVMTGTSNRGHINIKSVGFLNCIEKPFNVIGLVKLVKRIIDWQELRCMPHRRQSVRWPIMACDEGQWAHQAGRYPSALAPASFSEA